MRPAHLIQDLVAIVDPQLRVAALVAALGQGDAVAWISAISHAAAIAHGRHTSGGTQGIDAARAMMAIAGAAGSPQLSYAARQRLYEAAQEANHPELARLFFAASPPSADPRLVARQVVPQRQLERNGRVLTLGERRSLARTHRRDKLALVAKDPHPAVVAVLLGNPHVTEPDIVAIAAARHAVPESLIAIAEHPKWAARHAVKRSLVLNPATPLATALRVASTLPSRDLLEILELATLSAPLRAHVYDLVEQRQRAPAKP